MSTQNTIQCPNCATQIDIDEIFYHQIEQKFKQQHLEEQKKLRDEVENKRVDFGAFVDIGLKNDGMIHISEMSEKRIKHPLEVLSVNQYLARVEVISVDLEKNKVALSLKNI